MVAKDILRIALFLLVAIFALRSGSRIRVPGSVRIKSSSETEDTETQQLLQRLQDTRDKIKQEPTGYENKNFGKETSETSSGVNFSSNAVITIFALLMVLL